VDWCKFSLIICIWWGCTKNCKFHYQTFEAPLGGRIFQSLCFYSELHRVGVYCFVPYIKNMIGEFLNALQDSATQKMFLSIATVLLYLFFTSAVLCFKLLWFSAESISLNFEMQTVGSRNVITKQTLWQCLPMCQGTWCVCSCTIPYVYFLLAEKQPLIQNYPAIYKFLNQ